MIRAKKTNDEHCRLLADVQVHKLGDSPMATLLALSPLDHGRPMGLEEFEGARGRDGYRFELIDGKVYVSPEADLPYVSLEEWLSSKLRDYWREHPDVINAVIARTRVFVPGRPTAPQPDLAAYHDFPHHVPLKDRRWQDVSPVLVAEILSDDDPEKDLTRNVELYAQVPSIREYWIVDPRPDPDQPSLRVYRRRGQGWQRPLDFPFGATYTTRFLPEFTLIVDPRVP
jgi:Uma2 family endonuclease